jgi:hypothetical protein
VKQENCFSKKNVFSKKNLKKCPLQKNKKNFCFFFKKDPPFFCLLPAEFSHFLGKTKSFFLYTSMHKIIDPSHIEKKKKAQSEKLST